MIRLALLAAVGAGLTIAPALTRAQGDTAVAIARSAPRVSWSYGTAGGYMDLGDGARERAVGASLGLSLGSHFAIGVNQTYAWARGPSSTFTSQAGQSRTIEGKSANGLADLGVSASAWTSFAAKGSPAIGISAGATLPTGDTATVGSGRTSVGGFVWASMSPSSRLSLSGGTSVSLSNGYGTGLANSSLSSVTGSASLYFSRVSLSMSYSGDVGAVTDTGYVRAQSIAGGASIPLRGDVALFIDGSGGLTSGSPGWAVSVGIGTTAAGLAAVGIAAPVQRLRSAFGSGRTFKSTKPRTRLRSLRDNRR